MNDQNRPVPDDHPGTPRWVVVLGVSLSVLALIVIFMLLSGGDHGPGRHM